MLSDEELEALIEVGVEQRNVEFKSAGSTSSTEFMAVVARACIAMANQRDGGHVIVGVADHDPGGMNGGLDDRQLREWLDHDTVSAKVNVFADPPLQLSLAKRLLPTGAPVVVIGVAEFDRIPILSAKEFSGKIVRGQLYTRSMAKPESSASNTQNEIREVLDLATEKQLQTFLRTARHAGLAVDGHPGNVEQFKVEREGFLQHSLAADFVNVPHIAVAIHPEQYHAEFLAFDSLRETVRRSAVHLRGWQFPYMREVIYGDRWAGGREDRMHPEAWCLHQSGQFVDIQPFPAGYGPDHGGIRDDDSHAPFLPVWFPVSFITEATLFAGRIRKEAKFIEPLNATFRVTGAEGWELVAADPHSSGFHHSYRLGTNQWERSVRIDANILPEDLEVAAAETSRDFLLRFGWMGVTVDLIRGMQEQMLR